MQSDIVQTILGLLPYDILPLMVVLPILGSIIAYFAGSRGSRGIALLITSIELVLAFVLAFSITTTYAEGDPFAGMQFLWEYTFATLTTGSSDISFQLYLGVDGISVAMVILANLVVLIATISSNHINKSKGLYYALILLLQSGLLGVFMSLDLIGFFIFWELVLIPMFFIIGRWGEEGSQHAAIKFFIYTHLGSAVMLVGFFVLFFVSTPHTFNMLLLREMGLPIDIQIGFALAVFMGAGVKLPIFPLHNWLPWAHVKAPTPGSVILAGILLKMGGYGFIRLGLWLIPDAFVQLSIPFAILAIFTCIYAAFTALAQTDMKSMVAYTSINHMSWVLLGVAVGTSLAIQGAVFMMVSHGVIISVMFIMAGQLKYAAGTREIPDIQGLMTKAPKMSAVLILASFAAFGLPGLSGFVAEALIIFGSVVVYIWAPVIAFGIFLTVGYLLWTLNRIVFSEPDPEKDVEDAPWSDLIAPIIMLIPVILLGVWPDLILDLIRASADFIVGGVP
ncbi:MAG: NADH-quinone oxidoreductase subunit M [Candidatus Lokiarchaeota archaeon]|nr:NADH-quinone oxidoreductase subunit M [Candidatus Lokiarchaeota archaeon]